MGVLGMQVSVSLFIRVLTVPTLLVLVFTF